MDEHPQYGNDRNKLQKEEENLAMLKESLSRSDTMTQNMLHILNTFENRLSKLEETIIPIYQETGNLQRRHENIEKTLSALDYVLGYYHVAEEVDPVMRDDPSVNLDKYLACMEKLQQASAYFAKNDNSLEMSHVTTQFEAGKDALEREFHKMLSRHSKAVPPVMILDLLALEEDKSDEEEVSPLEQLPVKVHEDLVKLAKWLLNCGYSTDYMQVYSTLRSATVVRSLQALKDHLKAGSRDSSNMALSHSPALQSKFKAKDTPRKKADQRMEFVRRASTALKRHMAHLEAAGLGRASASGLDRGDDASDLDIDFYITSVTALLKLIESELALMLGIIPEEHQRKIFDHLIQASLDMIIKEGENISNNIKRATARHDTTEVIRIFPVLKHLRSIKPEFDRILEGCKVPTRAKLASLISILDTTGAKALDEFVDNIKNDPNKESYMPKDGTVHQLTSNAMLFLEQLLHFEDTAGAMLLTQDPTSLPNVKRVDRPKLKLAEFTTKVLSALGLNLNNKSETYHDTTLRSIFMLNNYNYIMKSLKKSGLLTIVHLWNNEVFTFYEDKVLHQKRIYSQRTPALRLAQMLNPQIETFYEDKIENQKRQYSTSWSRVLYYVAENQKPVTVGDPSQERLKVLKDKEKQAIKEKFTNFNKEFDELHRVQKGYAIPDSELRAALKQDNANYVLPFYRAFLKKYRNIHFTKNQEKYIKYSEEDIADMINGFFDSAA